METADLQQIPSNHQEKQSTSGQHASGLANKSKASCCVPTCNKPGYRVSEDGTKVTFHSFTKDEKLKRMWLHKIRRDEKEHEFTITPNTKICSRHFQESDFFITKNGRRFLKKDAVPSIFTWTVPTKARSQRLDNLEVGSRLGHVTNNQMNIDNPPSEYELLEAKVKELQEKLDSRDKECIILKKERNYLRELATTQKQKLSDRHTFSVDLFKNKDSDICFYTGFPSYTVFKIVFRLLDVGDKGQNVIQNGPNGPSASNDITKKGRKRIISPENQFFLVLMRLRLGLFEQDLANRFNVDTSTINRICLSWINYMYLKLGSINIWPTSVSIHENMPPSVKDKYPKLEWILDAFEIKCERPSSLYVQSQTYSNYKSTNTLKGLLACTPAGHIGFISQLYTGCGSDRELVERSGFLQLPHNQGAMWMVDKGFVIHDLASPLGVEVNMPAFVGMDDQMEEEDVVHTQEVASERIHIERAINKVKNFHIFDKPIPIAMWGSVNQIWAVCSLLTLFQNPIISA